MSDTPIDYSDVQGTVLRGYRVDLARHFILKITDSAAAKRLIGSMVHGTAGMPQIATADAGLPSRNSSSTSGSRAKV